MDQLTRKLEAVEAIRAKLTEEYLQHATKPVLQGDIDEVDNLVKNHHEIYDRTNWAEQPKAETIGYENRKNRIATLRDETLKILNDQIGKIILGPQQKDQSKILEELTTIREQIESQKGQLTAEYFAQTDADTKAVKKSEIKTVFETYQAKSATIDEASLTNQQREKLLTEREQISTLRNEIEEIFTNPPKIKEKKPQLEYEDLTRALERIMGEFDIIKRDIANVRTEIVAKEALANQKIQGIEKKFLERQV